MGVELYLLLKKHDGFFVRFVDYNDTLIDEQWVDTGGDAIPPASPIHSGMTFNSWNKSFNDIQEDTIIRATYTIQYVILWRDFNGELLKTEYVEAGSNGNPPEPPVRFEFNFLSWSLPYTNVQTDLDIYAIYEVII